MRELQKKKKKHKTKQGGKKVYDGLWEMQKQTETPERWLPLHCRLQLTSTHANTHLSLSIPRVRLSELPRWGQQNARSHTWTENYSCVRLWTIKHEQTHTCTYVSARVTVVELSV